MNNTNILYPRVRDFWYIVLDVIRSVTILFQLYELFQFEYKRSTWIICSIRYAAWIRETLIKHISSPTLLSPALLSPFVKYHSSFYPFISIV